MEIDIEHNQQVRDGEWHIFEHYKNTAGERTRVLDSFGVLVAETQTEAQAARIVADYAAVERLVEVLKLTRRLLVNQQTCERSLCNDCNDTRQAVLEGIDTALATVADGGRETENGHTCIDINNAPTGVPCNACRLERS